MLDEIVFFREGPFGAFEQTYSVEAALSNQQQQALVEWLVNSLSENFIFVEKVTKTIAGGYTNNYKAWQQGRFKKSRHRSPEYEIRIHKEDIPIFEMVWYKNIHQIDNSQDGI